MEKKHIWQIQAIVAIGLWVFFIILWIWKGNFWFTLALFVLHLGELVLVGYKIGREQNYTRIETLFFILVFGYIWWLPVKQGIYTNKH